MIIGGEERRVIERWARKGFKFINVYDSGIKRNTRAGVS